MRRKHSSRMHAARLETLCASVSVATSRCPSQGGPQMNKLEKVSSDCHLMALAGGGARSRGVTGLMSRGDVGEGRSNVQRGGGRGRTGGGLYSEVQCILGNGHIGIPCGQTQTQTHTHVKILPSHNFVGGR